MDPLCHTLVGAVLAESGLKRRTALAEATLIIGANAPDIDVLSIPFGHSLDFRRGWTHGVLALVVLPLILTWVMLAWDRFRRRRGVSQRMVPAKPREILLLSALAIATHPTLDFLNTYGMRWLMPFSNRWFYGDTLFIIDPWVWIALAVGIVLTRRRLNARSRAPHRPARIALAAVTSYVLVMTWLGRVARREVVEVLEPSAIPQSVRHMAAPVPANPLRRDVMIEDGAVYRGGSVTFWPSPRFTFDGPVIPRRADEPAARAAAATPLGREFLRWARFPFFVIEPSGDATVVRIADARYAGPSGASWAAVEIRLPSTPPVVPETGSR